MSRTASPTVIGAFVVAGVTLALVLIIVLGGGQLFRETVRVVVYFDGSVNGLRVGAPVKFRGIEIGSVKDVRINMSGMFRDARDIRIPVILEIDKDRLKAQGVTQTDLHDRAQVQALVDRGLRAELATESLVTGVRYVALDVKPDTPARMEHDPAVADPEIPSVRGPLELAPEKINKFLASLAEVDIASIGRSIDATAADAHRLLGSPQVTRAIAGLDGLTKNLNRTVLELDKTTRALEPMVAEWSQTATSARRLISPEGAFSSQLGATLNELQAAARSLRRLADHLDRDPGALLRGGRQ